MQSNLQVICFIFFICCQCCFLNCNTAIEKKSISKSDDSVVIEKPTKANGEKQMKEQISKVDSLEKNNIQQPGSIENPNSYPIVGGWRLTKFHTDTIEILNDQTPHIVINLFAMKISGTDGCNTMSGSILNFKNDRIKFGKKIKQTLIACMFRYDRKFMGLLALTRKYKIKASNKLFFLNEDGDVLLEFERANYDYFKNG